MFDPSLVVQRAASTFNNAALVAPNFFWTALLAAPIFIAAWIFAPMIAERFLSDSKKRDFNISILAVVSIFIWTLSHQAFGALRDFSFIGILCAVILCACASFLSRRYYGEFKNLRVSKLIKNEKWKPRADAAVPAVLVAIAAFAGEHTIAGMALSGGAVAIGWLAGWMLERRGAATRDPKFIVAA
ncbi:MAG: hypothetical protein FWF34_02760, partial [Alphaproteobacteria bacterium]|nr:hypothetical protein [Alphaproteobacteria bacterium]